MSGTLTFADGVTSQGFSIHILDDAMYEGNESLSLTLSNPTGGTGLGAPFTAALKIAENDVQTTVVNAGGSSGGGIDLISLLLLLSLYSRNYRKNAGYH